MTPGEFGDGLVSDTGEFGDGLVGDTGEFGERFVRQSVHLWTGEEGSGIMSDLTRRWVPGHFVRPDKFSSYVF